MSPYSKINAHLKNTFCALKDIKILNNVAEWDLRRDFFLFLSVTFLINKEKEDIGRLD